MIDSKKRFKYMIILGIIMSILLKFIVKFEGDGKSIFFGFLASILTTIVVWEGNLWIDKWMNSRYPWIDKPVMRIIIQLPVSIIYSAITIYILTLGLDKYLCPVQVADKSGFVTACMILGVVISITILSVEAGNKFFGYWKASLVEVEKYKTESLQAQLQNLKNQINPHFLFNNMSVLSSLVYKDQDKAVDFINQLSKVYRYLLDNKDKELVTLEEELTFIRSYTYLLQIRFDTNIQFKINVDEGSMQRIIPPMALQILVENAIKHNEISEAQPLVVEIQAHENEIVVKNNLQLRSNSETSSKTGLQNIKDRYRYFTDNEIEVIQDPKYFSVKIPLLNSKKTI
jgi:two-component system, LytTR family, sensor kinase